MKIKHSVSSPTTKYGRTSFFFSFFFWQIYGGMLHMGTNDQIKQGGKMMVIRFQRPIQVSFPLIDPDPSY